MTYEYAKELLQFTSQQLNEKYPQGVKEQHRVRVLTAALILEGASDKQADAYVQTFLMDVEE